MKRSDPPTPPGTPPRTPPRNQRQRVDGTPPSTPPPQPTITIDELESINEYVFNQNPTRRLLAEFRNFIAGISTRLNTTTREVRELYQEELERRTSLNQNQIVRVMRQYDYLATGYGESVTDIEKFVIYRPRGTGVKRRAPPAQPRRPRPPAPPSITNGEVQSIFSIINSGDGSALHPYDYSAYRDFRFIIEDIRRRVGDGARIGNLFMDRLPNVFPTISDTEREEIARRFIRLSSFDPRSVTQMEDFVMKNPRRPPQGRGMYYKTW